MKDKEEKSKIEPTGDLTFRTHGTLNAHMIYVFEHF